MGHYWSLVMMCICYLCSDMWTEETAVKSVLYQISYSQYTVVTETGLSQLVKSKACLMSTI